MRTKLALGRWIWILALAIVGAIVFESILPLGWHYAKALPDPTRWFSLWFLRLSLFGVLLAIAYLLAEPIRFRLRYMGHLHVYPPLSASIVLAIVFAGIGETWLLPLRKGSVPSWTDLDVLAPLALAAIIGTALRQIPWHKKAIGQPAPAREKIQPITWEVISAWFRREDPLDDGPDLLGHSSIAERIHDAVARSENLALALIGPIGSGKSSILNLVQRALKTDNQRTLDAEFNCWAMPRPEDAPRIALEKIIDALDREIDVQSIRRLPISYQRLLSAEPSGRISRVLGLDEIPDPAEQLKQLSPLLKVIDARVLLVIEDAERAGRSFEARQLERLLWTLRRVDRVSFILSFDADKADFDYAKLCDLIERIPQISVDRVEALITPAYVRWRAVDPRYIDPLSEEQRRDGLGFDDDSNSMLRYVRRIHGDSVADAITALMRSPRNLKHFIRDVDRAWLQLRGEVELNDLIVMTALRHGAPEAFDFIVANAEAARSESKDRDSLAGHAEKTVKARWEKVRDSLARPTEIQTLVDVLGLNKLSADRFASRASPQGIMNEGPVDYLGRILAGRILPDDIPDQVVLRDIEDWKASRSGPMIRNLQAATDKSDLYVRIWEHYAGRLSDDELIEVAGLHIAYFRDTLGANASIDRPALIAVWRRCNRRFRDSHTEWLINQIESVMAVSLGFATDLFQYWASVPNGIVSSDHRAGVRKALVESAQRTFKTPADLLAVLGPEHRYALTRLVYPGSHDEPSDTIPSDSWAWLAELLVGAATIDEERIVPDVVAMVGDTAYGVRSGNFEQRYKLERERMTGIFGDWTDKMLAALAEYGGKDEHAVAAKQQAKAWLIERRQSDESRSPAQRSKS